MATRKQERLIGQECGRHYIVTVSSPLQLRNAVAFLRTSRPDIRAVTARAVFVVILSGHSEWDLQTLATATKLGVKKIILVFRPGQRNKRCLRKDSEAAFNIRLAVVAPLGSLAAGRFLALVLAKVLASVSSSWRSAGTILVTGMPLNLLPLYPLVLAGKRQVVVVDDGLSTLEFFRLRGQQAPNHRKKFLFSMLFSRPGTFERNILCYTLFHDISGPQGVHLLPNTTFSSVSHEVSVKRKEAWILGNPFVEEGGLDLRAYQAVIAALKKALYRHTPKIRYLPHRRENPKVTAELLNGLDLLTDDWRVPVEERVLEAKTVARVVVGFGSTGLEILSQMTGPQCLLWNVLLIPPFAKTGADSPEEIFRRHTQAQKIHVVKADEILKTDFVPGR